ncbi:MAG: hypothetical protein ACR2NH_10905 [Solirubrobacteraceae bacterium]
MATTKRPDLDLWHLATTQHGVLTHAQLLAARLTQAAIRHRTGNGRLWRVHPGVFAVGRREMTRDGRWMAPVLACGPDAVLSHGPAGVCWEILDARHAAPLQVSVPGRAGRVGPRGITVHRPAILRPDDTTRHRKHPGHHHRPHAP